MVFVKNYFVYLFIKLSYLILFYFKKIVLLTEVKIKI